MLDQQQIDDQAQRIAIRGGLDPESFIQMLRSKLITAELSKEELREYVRITKEKVAATGSLQQTAPKTPKVKGGKKAAANLNIDDLFGELDGL